MKKLLLIGLLGVTVVVGSASAQITFNNALNGTYSQSFNSLTSAGTWTNNSTLTGWYAATTATNPVTAIALNTGSTTGAGLYSFGTASTPADRALGYVASNAFTGASGTGQGFVGFQLTNATSFTMTQFALNYTGEEYRKESNASSQTLTVQYKINTTSLTDASGWTTIAGLTFTSPIVGATGTTVLDGNASANRVVFANSLVTGVSMSVGDSVWIRWVDLNDSGNDHALAIDDVTFTAIPEPHEYGIALGALLGIVILIRRKASQG